MRGYTKPSAGAQINWNDPLAFGLAVALPLAEGSAGAVVDAIYDAVAGRQCASSDNATTFWTPAQKGLALQFPAANGQFELGNKGLTQRCSFACRIALGTAPPSAACIFGTGTAGLIWGVNSGRTIRFQKAGVGILGNSTTALTLERVHDIGVSFDGATIRFYLDGIANGTAASTQTLGDANWQFGADGTGSTELAQNAKVFHAFAWVNRVLTAGDFQALAVQPYRLFAPQSPRRFFTGSTGSPSRGNYYAQTQGLR